MGRDGGGVPIRSRATALTDLVLLYVLRRFGTADSQELVSVRRLSGARVSTAGSISPAVRTLYAIFDRDGRKCRNRSAAVCSSAANRAADSAVCSSLAAKAADSKAKY